MTRGAQFGCLSQINFFAATFESESRAFNYNNNNNIDRSPPSSVGLRSKNFVRSPGHFIRQVLMRGFTVTPKNFLEEESKVAMNV
jgi:hypothetical protein